MSTKLAFSVLMLLSVLSGCSSEENIDAKKETFATENSISSDDQIDVSPSENTLEAAEVDYGMGHYTDENIESAQEYYQEESSVEGRGDIISDEFAYSGDNPPFEVGIYTELDQTIESARYASMKYGDGLYADMAPKYDTYVSIISEYDGEVTINDVVINKGQSCALGNGWTGSLRYGEKTARKINYCDVDQVRHILIQTNIGDFKFGF